MRERINRLAKGIVDAEIPEVFVLPETCGGMVTAGQVCRKELYVADRYGCFVKGLVCAGAGKFFRGKPEPYLL